MRNHHAIVSTLYTVLGAVALTSTLAGTASAQILNLELLELTGENDAARNVYLCNCTLDQYLNVPLPGPNWQKNTSAASNRFIMADEVSSIAPTPPPGTPTTLDLIPEIPGPDHLFIARVLSASFIGFGPQGAFLQPQVARGTTLTYHAGSIIHTVRASGGPEYVLFSMDGASMTTYDPFVVGGLSGLAVPVGWSYSSEVLTEDLIVGTPGGVANLFSQANGIATYQQLIVVPEPATASLVLLGLVGLAMRERRVR